jgi:hypothetical protein
MKYSVCLMTMMMAAVVGSIFPEAVHAETLISQVISGGYTSTTIYVPFGTTTTTTTTTDRVITNSYSYPDTSSFSTSTTDYNGGFYYTNRRRAPQQTVIFQQNNIYRGSGRSICSTSIIGSPIPSPIPLNQFGTPCR